jgi:DNA-binding HxlR family transcriptional regulator
MALRLRKNRVGVPPEAIAVKRNAGGASECPLNRCMDLLGGAWAPHVVWYLGAQPRRFGELRIDIPRISARVLSQRLRELQAKGVVTRTVAATTPPSSEYALTDLGRELLPALAAIADVGRKLENRSAAPRRRWPPGPGRR